MRKLISLVVALMALAAVTASAALAAGSINYTGQGMDANGASNQKCGTSADDGGTGQGIPANGQYLLWVLTQGPDSGTVTLHLPDGNVSMINVGGGNTHKYVSGVMPNVS